MDNTQNQSSNLDGPEIEMKSISQRVSHSSSESMSSDEELKEVDDECDGSSTFRNELQSNDFISVPEHCLNHTIDETVKDVAKRLMGDRQGQW